jgi:hypothetical protein
MMMMRLPLIVFQVPLNNQLVAAAAERPTNRY